MVHGLIKAIERRSCINTDTKYVEYYNALIDSINRNDASNVLQIMDSVRMHSNKIGDEYYQRITDLKLGCGALYEIAVMGAIQSDDNNMNRQTLPLLSDYVSEMLHYATFLKDGAEEKSVVPGDITPITATYVQGMVGDMMEYVDGKLEDVASKNTLAKLHEDINRCFAEKDDNTLDK